LKQQRVHERICKHIRDLGSPDQKVAIQAERYLLRWYGVRALEPLIAACSDPNPQVRFRSGWVLGYTHDPRAFETILKLTQDPDGFVRYDAAIALGILGDERAISPLISLMQQPDEGHSVDSAAAMGLVRLGQAAIPALLEVLARGAEEHQCKAAYILGSLKAEQAIPSLTSLLSSPNEHTRIAGIESLAKIGNADCLALIKLLQSDPVPRVSENADYWVRDLEGEETFR